MVKIPIDGMRKKYLCSLNFCGLSSFSNMIALSAVSLSLGSYVNALFGIHVDTIIYAISFIILFASLNIALGIVFQG